MIRLGKPVQLFEWGEGTNTLNQRWDKIADGKLLYRPDPWYKIIANWFLQKRTCTNAGEITLAFEVAGPFDKKNSKDETIKICQPSEGMNPSESLHKWGEVAVGRLKALEPESDGKTKVYVAIKGATKIGR